MTDDLARDLAAVARQAPACPADRFDGRGIVICAGGARLFTCAWVQIALLRRHLGCALPIEVWHLGPAELGPPMRALLHDLDAQPVDALDVARRHPMQRAGGWELKPYAMMHSRFREVLLLDADNVPVRDPAFLFDTPDYQATGTLFWPDIVRLARDNPIWRMAGLPFHDSPSLESGQILLDKARCWPALSLAHWINQRSDTFYTFLHGDKDTFLIAWLLAGLPFDLIPHRPRLLEHTICQRDPSGAVLFQHRNNAKWILHGDNPRIEGFRLEADCLALLDELRARWDGTVFNPPERPAAARRAEALLQARRTFLLTRVSSDAWPLDLLSGHRTGRGMPNRPVTWHVQQTETGLELILASQGRTDCALRMEQDGVWRGRWAWSPGMPVELAPVSAEAGEVAAPVPVADGPLTALLDRIVARFASVPMDNETARDLLGTMRTLALTEPGVADHMRALAAGTAADDTTSVAGLISLALSGLPGAAAEPPKAGSYWPHSGFALQPGNYIRDRAR